MGNKVNKMTLGYGVQVNMWNNSNSYFMITYQEPNTVLDVLLASSHFILATSLYVKTYQFLPYNDKANKAGELGRVTQGTSTLAQDLS